MTFNSSPVAAVLGTVLSIGSTSAARGQQDTSRSAKDPSFANSIITPSNPPLTEGMVDLYMNFNLQVIGIPDLKGPVAPQHRDMVRAMLIKAWRNPAEMKKEMSTVSLAESLEKKTPEERWANYWDLQALALAGFRQEKSPYAQWMLAAYERENQPIAPGNPPLTENMVSRFSSFLLWVLEIPHEAVQEVIAAFPLTGSIREMLVEDWKKPKEIKNDMAFLNWQKDLSYRSNEEREYMRLRAQQDIINGVRADKDSSSSRWIVKYYDESHPIIAAGNPPLTRQATDAYSEHFCFTHNQGGGAPVECTKALKDGFAQQFAQTYSSLPPEQQKKLADMPQTWALLKLAWATTSEADHQKLRARWQPPQAGAAAAPKRDAALAASARFTAFRKKDQTTVSEQELLDVAKDCDIVAQEYQREGGEANLKLAAGWEQSARTFRMGREGYVKQYLQGLAQQ